MPAPAPRGDARPHVFGHPQSTNRTSGRKARRFLLIWFVSLLLAGCSAGPDARVPNQRPGLRLTGGPIEGEAADYDAEFFWAGWDADGVIDHYQYVIDVPPHVTTEDLDNPGDTGIGWRDTTVVRARFRFRTPEPDTMLCEGGLSCFSGRYKGRHSIHVRAVDNEGMVSRAESRRFTPRTIVPVSRITSPRVVAGGPGFIRVGRMVRFCWTGEDPDSRTPDRRPAAYEWKLIPVPSVTNLPDANYTVHDDPGPNFPWNRAEPEAPCVTIPLETPRNYVFVVRAIDEVGGTEQDFDWGRNAMVLQASGSPTVGRPILTVREKSLGTAVFPEAGDVVDFEVAVGRSLRFEFSGTADVYGGVIQGFSLCVDAVDDLAEGSASGCSPWSLIPYSIEPIRFREAGIHVVSVRCRDSSGAMTVGRFRLAVVDFPRDRELLYVDDSYDLGDPRLPDAEVDRRLKGAFAAAGVQTLDEFPVFGAQDLDFGLTAPRLSDLARFRLVFWSVNGVGGGVLPGESALLRSSSCATGRILQAYVAAGGAVWIAGQRPSASLKLNAAGGSCLAKTNYDHRTGLEFTPGDFPCDFLHFCPRDVRTVKPGSPSLGLIGARPTAVAAAEGLPPLSADPATYAAALGGVIFYDAQFQRYDSPDPGLDTLYVAETAIASSFSGRPIAWRYADLTGAGDQGAVALFGFPLQNMRTGAPGEQLEGVVGSMLAWFRRHQSPGF